MTPLLALVLVLQPPPLLMGADWYPEQWPESRWETDARMMEAAHLDVTRIGEFAWSTMEPREGQYDLDWLDRVIRVLEKHHIRVVLGTPSAAPPAWLTSKYPDVLRVEENGVRVTHGNRAQASPTSTTYRALCRRIVEAMAVRFGHDPDVVGWQIDNEYGYAQMSYDSATRAQFQDFLRAKYGSLDALNAHWTTAYWSQTYDRWDEIPIPIGAHNPGLMLDWKRFVTTAWTDYERNQIDVIRAHADPRQFVTGNFMGVGFDGFDHYVVAQPLTLVAWDDYVGSGHLDPVGNGMSHDAMRGLLRQNFWEIETQPGSVNWAPLNNSLDKGEVRAMAWHAVAHGADEVSYWQWRGALNGQEEMHGTLIGPDGEPEPLLDEVARTAAEFAKAGDAFRGTRVVSAVAMLNDYESRWAIDWQRHTTRWNTLQIARDYYGAIRRIAQSVDVVSPYAPLDGYALVIAPSLEIIPDSLARHLLAYVRGGGHLVLGPRSGMKDQYNALVPMRQPGFLREALGAKVEQFYALDKTIPVRGALGAGHDSVWAEYLTAHGADVLLRYGTANGWLDGQPAAVTRQCGNGRLTYIGAVLDAHLLDSVALWMARTSHVKPVFGTVPDGVEVSRRVGSDGKALFVLINFASGPREIALPRAMWSVLDAQRTHSVHLTRFGVSVIMSDSGPPSPADRQ
jgi:beta-galactosidase